jgi:alkylation response protein AidB-like acyl-CoA dehydrogenase
MDFSWTPEQLELRDSVLEFARKALDDGFEARERAGTFSRALWRACAEFGIHGLPIPEEYGGSGQDPLTTMLAMEALGLGCRDQGLLFSIHAQMWSIEMPILKFGTAEQRAHYLPPLCDGSLIGAHGMTEPDTGSDAFALRTRAEKRGDCYVLNGTKMFVTNAPESELILVFATVAPKRGMWGVTAFLVDRDTPGISTGNPIPKMGLTTSPMGEIVFEDCQVPASALLGREGQGSVIFNHSMAWERSCILASTVGAMEHQLDVCLTYARERHQFGRPIGSFQLVAAMMAEMKLRLETSRLLLYRAAWTQASGADNALDGAMAKLYISEASVQSALDAIQVHGGYGFMREFGVERDLRDNMGARLYSGTSEIQRLMIARHLGLRPE